MIRSKILLIEDDLGLASTLKDFFEDNGLTVLHAPSGEIGLEVYTNESPDLIILDIILPEKNGFEVIDEIRKNDMTTPIIMITGSELDDASHIRGYDSGATNYVLKPVSPSVLLAQIRAKLIPKTPHTQSKKIYRLGNLIAELDKQSLITKDCTVKLRERDATVLEMLLDNKNNVVLRSSLLQLIWNTDSPTNNNMLDGIITRLRKALVPFDNIQIINQYGSGFILQVD